MAYQRSRGRAADRRGRPPGLPQRRRERHARWLQAALRADPAARRPCGRERLVKQPGFEGDAPVTVLCRRPERARPSRRQPSRRCSAAARGRPAVAVATARSGTAASRGSTRAATTRRPQGRLLRPEEQLGGFQDVLIRAVPAEFVRLEDADAGRKIGAGAKAGVAPPRQRSAARGQRCTSSARPGRDAAAARLP